MNIDKYIKNTKKKTKKAKLPALSTLTPIMPDGAAGIATFNASFGEDLSSSDIDKLRKELESQCKSFMLEKGFEEEDLPDVLQVNINRHDDYTNITITADLTIGSLREMADYLYPVISKYDDTTYFDISTNNSISVDLDMEMNITEKLHKLDKVGFDLYCEDYDFEALYESTKTKLDADDRAKLQKFLQTTDDPEAVNTYMKGLLMEEAEEENMNYTYSVEFDEILDAFQTLQDAINHLVGEANSNGNDSLRVSADLASGALDDFRSYLGDIQEELGDLDKQNKTKSLPRADVYVQKFLDLYPTAQEFEDATDTELKDFEVEDIVWKWVIDDTGLEGKDEVLADDLVWEATEKIMKELS